MRAPLLSLDSFLALRERSVFSRSQFESNFDKATCWHVRFKIWRWSNVLVLNKRHWQNIGLLGHNLRVEICLAQYYVWIGWSKVGKRYTLSCWGWVIFMRPILKWLDWLISPKRITTNPGQSAYAACSQGCIKPACVRHCSRFIFSLSASTQCFFYIPTWITFW